MKTAQHVRARHFLGTQLLVIRYNSEPRYRIAGILSSRVGKTLLEFIRWEYPITFITQLPKLFKKVIAECTLIFYPPSMHP